MSKILISSINIGTVTGLLLLIFFAYIQMMADIQIMDLLLNIDFIYQGQVNIFIEISLHLIISIIIAFVLKTVYVYKRSWYLFVSITILLITVGLYFILQSLSYSVTISDNSIGFIMWVIFHIGYFELIYYMYRSGY